jgi:hypothetical protein
LKLLGCCIHAKTPKDIFKRYQAAATPKQSSQTMTHVKIQSHTSLREEMKRVARGEKKASKDTKVASFNSVEALLRLLKQKSAGS